MIDLTRRDDGDSEGGAGDHTEVSWLRTIRTAQHRVRLIPSFLMDRIQVADQLRLPLTALSAKVTYIHSRRLHNVRLQRSRPVGRDTLGSIPLRGLSCTINFNSIPTSLLITMDDLSPLRRRPAQLTPEGGRFTTPFSDLAQSDTTTQSPPQLSGQLKPPATLG